MNRLVTTLRISDPDEFYQKLMDALRDLDEEQAMLFNARLILILANHIGDDDVLAEAVSSARGSIGENSAVNHDVGEAGR